jgi:glutathione S-transferase
MKLRLYDWGPSPFCLKVRAILDYKRLPYQRLNVLGKAIIELNRRGTGKVPALEIDGELVSDSTDIAYALERIAPTPAIIPTKPRDRAVCHAIEEWADEAIYYVALYYQWWDPAGRAAVPQAFGRGPLGRVAYQIYLRRVLGQLRGQGVARKSPAQIRDDLERHIAASEGLLSDRSYLLGDAPMLCDFALMGQLVYLQRTPVGQIALEDRPTIAAYLERMKALRGESGAAKRAAVGR